VVFSQFFWPAALQQLTGLLADGPWVPMATVHFGAVSGALLAGWMAFCRDHWESTCLFDCSIALLPNPGIGKLSMISRSILLIFLIVNSRPTESEVH
jgi:hypothetical protein